MPRDNISHPLNWMPSSSCPIMSTESCTGEESFAPTFAPATVTTATPQSPSRTIGSIFRGPEIVIPCKGEASVLPIQAFTAPSRSDASAPMVEARDRHP